MIDNIIAKNKKVFIDGKETTDPSLIGYALLDAIEDGFKLMFKKDDVEIFNNKDIVYLVHDIEQKPRMIISTNINSDCILYELISGVEVSTHYGYELSKTKKLHL